MYKIGEIMNDQLQNKLVEVIGDIQSNASQAKLAILDQVPDVVQQWLMFELYKSSVWLVIAIIGLLSTALLLRAVRKQTTWKGDSEPLAYTYIIIGSIVYTIMFFVNIQDVVQILLAPKVWIIEHMSQIMKIIKG